MIVKIVCQKFHTPEGYRESWGVTIINPITRVIRHLVFSTKEELEIFQRSAGLI